MVGYKRSGSGVVTAVTDNPVGLGSSPPTDTYTHTIFFFFFLRLYVSISGYLFGKYYIYNDNNLFDLEINYSPQIYISFIAFHCIWIFNGC